MLCPYMGKTVAIPGGELEGQFDGIIKMNETSADIWRWVEAGKEAEEIYPLYARTYGVDENIARKDVDSVILQMREAGIFTE